MQLGESRVLTVCVPELKEMAELRNSFLVFGEDIIFCLYEKESSHLVSSSNGLFDLNSNLTKIHLRMQD